MQTLILTLDLTDAPKNDNETARILQAVAARISHSGAVDGPIVMYVPGGASHVLGTYAIAEAD